MSAAHTSRNFLHVLVPGNDPTIDIVAVHGLNPLHQEFHAEKTWMVNDKLWLRDFLPSALPQARVLLFGYNSNVAFQTNMMGVRENALNLLDRLSGKRRQSSERPIIFICHSLGGIVVKKALVEAKLNDAYSSIRTATYGIAFFATPHQGSNLASLGDIAANIARITLHNPSNSLLENLARNSSFLEDLAESFKHQLEDYYVLSFYEQRPWKKIGTIVDKSSARLGLPGTREKQIPVDADHSNICKFASEDGDDYEQVIHNIASLAESALRSTTARKQTGQIPTVISNINGVATKSVFLVPYARNVGFVGRHEIIEAINNLTRFEQQTQCPVALYGLGGVGKTQLAIQCAYLVHQNRPDVSVFWIHASNLERFYQSFVKIADTLEIPEADSPKADVLALVRDWLQQGRCGPWLMVVDNADNIDMLYSSPDTNEQGQRYSLEKPVDYLPTGLHGVILLTTRDKKVAARIAKGNAVINIPRMTGDESRALVRRFLGDYRCKDVDLDKLTETLEFLPLALVQASSFILENSMCIETYLGRYLANKDNAVELLSQDFESAERDPEIRNPVATTWMISFKQIKDQHPRAADLLSLMAYLDPSGVPEELLRQQHADMSDVMFDIACGVLKSFSLISEDPVKVAGDVQRLFTLHRMVQLVTQKWLVMYDLGSRWADNALVAVSKVFLPADSEHWKAHETYLPHVQMVLGNKADSTSEIEHKGDLLHNASWYFRVRGYHSRAHPMGAEALTIRRNMLGESHPDTRSSIIHLSRILFEQGQLSKAEDLLLPAINLSNAAPGETDAETLSAIRHLAAIQGCRGRYREAEQLQLQVIETSKKVLGAEHQDTLLAMRDLAMTYRFQGRHEDAKSLQLKVYETRRRVLGDDHPETIIIMHDLASTYLELLQLKEAETMELEMIRRCKRVLGGEHPHTLEGLRTLEFIFGIDGRRDEWLRIRQEILGLSSTIQINKIQPPLTTHTMSDQIVTYQKDTITPELRSLIKTNSFRGATDTPRYSSQSEPITIATKENPRGEGHDNPSTTGGASLNNTSSKVTHGIMRQYVGSVTSTMARRSKSEIVVEHAENVLLDHVTESSQNDTGEGRTRKKRIWGMQRLLDKGIGLLKKGDHMETRIG